MLAASMSSSSDAADLINLARYPIADLASPAARGVISDGRAQLARNGLCLLHDFLEPGALALMAQEACSLLPFAYYKDEGMMGDGSGRLNGRRLPRPSRNAAAAIAYDRLAPASPIRRLYEWDGLVGLFRELLGVERFYRCADPIISCLLIYYGDGDELGWHFDPNNGVVTLLLQAPEQGGEFEFVPDIRRHDTEDFPAIAHIMDGAREGVITAPIRPGTLSLFQGVDSLHRVTRVTGPRPRIMLTMSFDTEPGAQFSPEIRRRYSGRVA